MVEDLEKKMASLARGIDPYTAAAVLDDSASKAENRTDIGKHLFTIFLLRLRCIIDRKISTSEARHLGYEASPNQASSKTKQVTQNHNRP